MLATTVFTAPFGFVVWTVSSLYEFAVQSLHLPLARLGSGLACRNEAFPEFDEFYYEAVCDFIATQQESTVQRMFRHHLLQVPCSNQTELRARITKILAKSTNKVKAKKSVVLAD